MIEAVDFSIDLENGEYLAHVMLFNIEDTIIEGDILNVRREIDTFN